MMKFKNVLAFLALIAIMVLFGAAGCGTSVTGKLELPDNAVAIALSEDGNTAYIADATKGLRIIDVSDVANPVERASYEGATKAFKIALKGTLCLIGDYMSGIRAVDTTDPDSLIVNLSDDSILPGSLKVVGNYLFSGDIKDGLKSFELNASSPYLEDACSCVDTDGVMAMAVSAADDIAYVVENQKGLMMIDVSDPSNMQQVGSVLSEIKNANDVEVMGDYVYVATSDNVQIIDVSDSDHPSVVGNFGNSCLALSSSGSFLYCANGDAGLSKWDCSTPDSPDKKMGKTFGSSSPVLDVVVSGDFAYMACENGGLVITDITD